MRLTRLTIALVLLALIAPAIPVAAQTIEPVLAYIKEGNVWLRYDNGQDLAITNDAARLPNPISYPNYYRPGYSSPRWSPDGKWLAFVRSDESGYTLYITDVTKEAIIIEPVVGGLPIAFPPAWRDAQTLTYAVVTDQRDQLLVLYNVFTVNVEDTARPTTHLGGFWYGEGCGGGTSDPSQLLYGSETLSLGGNYPIFDWSGTLIVHSVNCTGAGVAAFDVDTQTDTVISDELTRAAVSPDKFWLAGILPTANDDVSKIEIYNLANPNAAPRQITASDIPGTTAAQLAWDLDSTDLYYSLQQFEGDRVTTDAQQQRALDLFGSSPVAIRIFFCGLRHYNLTTDTVARVYTAPSYAFASIEPLDGNNVLFTQIDNAGTWLDLFEQGKSAADLSYNLPRTYIVQVTLEPAGSEIVIEDAGQAAVRPQAE